MRAYVKVKVISVLEDLVADCFVVDDRDLFSVELTELLSDARVYQSFTEKNEFLKDSKSVLSPDFVTEPYVIVPYNIHHLLALLLI